MSEPKWKKLQWKIEYLDPDGKLKRPKAGSIRNLGPQLFFAVRGKIPKDWPYLYVVRVGADTQILRIALEARLKELGATAGREVRLPQPGTYLFNATKGAISVLALDREITRDELAKLIGAREPSAPPTTRDSTVSADDAYE